MAGSLLRWMLAGAAVGISCSSAPIQNAQPTSVAASTSAPDAAQVQRFGEVGVTYLSMDGVDLTMDVRVPPEGVDESAGWPVLVLFHGLSSSTNDADHVTSVADAAAAAGMVVFTPEWIAGDPFPLLLDDIVALERAGECAVAFAQQEAPGFGGDPTLTVTSGFSAGTGPALMAATAPPGDAMDARCVAAPRPAAVVGTVLGDGEYFWQSEPFDGAFDAEPGGMLGATRRLIEPANWTADPALRIRLWAAADGTAPRPLAEDDGERDWLTARDADGSIRSDLAASGALDDGIVDYVDSATLLQRRAEAAGFDAQLEILPGGHTTSDKVPTIVEHLLAAAAES